MLMEKKSEIFTVAATWAIGGGIGQLVLLPFGMASGHIWFGLILGATAQSVIYYYFHGICKSA